MVDSGPLVRFGLFSSQAQPAAGYSEAPSESVGQYVTHQLTDVVTGTVGSVVYQANHYYGLISASEVTYYKMRGMDNAVDGLYDTWITINFIDVSASQYTGTLVTPLRDVIVINKWKV